MKTKLRIFFFGISILTLIAFIVPSDKYFSIAKNLDIFTTLFKEIDTYYVDEIDPEKFIKTGIKSMIGSLDQYSEFITEEEARSFELQKHRRNFGIGVQLVSLDGKIIVKGISKDSPAYLAGLKIGDELKIIDGKTVNNKKIDEVSSLLDGRANTSAGIKMIRHGKELDFNITREEIKTKSVEEQFMVTKEIGYIRLDNLNSGASEEMKQALDRLNSPQLKRLILDLRNNQGGMLNEAISVVNFFLPIGTAIVSTKSRIKEFDKTYVTLNATWNATIPLVVLTGRVSAAESEIVAGALQDYDRALLIGQRTCGNGLVQTTKKLVYNTELKISVAKYVTPSGRSIQSQDTVNQQFDSQVENFSDSLNFTFYSKSGRKFYNANGLMPDILIEKKQLNSDVEDLIKSQLIFEFALKFCSENTVPEDYEKVAKSPKQYHEFEEWLQQQDPPFSSQLEKKVDELIVVSERETNSNSINSILKKLKTQLYANRKTITTKYMDVLLPILHKEIASQYGIYEFKKEIVAHPDKEIIEAIRILENEVLYKKLLKPN